MSTFSSLTTRIQGKSLIFVLAGRASDGFNRPSLARPANTTALLAAEWLSQSSVAAGFSLRSNLPRVSKRGAG